MNEDVFCHFLFAADEFGEVAKIKPSQFHSAFFAAIGQSGSDYSDNSRPFWSVESCRGRHPHNLC